MRYSRRQPERFLGTSQRRLPTGFSGALELLRWYLCKILCPPAPGRPVISFLPQQLHMFVKHDKGLDSQKIAAQTLNETNKLLVSIDACEVALVSPERVISFDDGDRAFSLVFADLPATRDNKRIVQLAAALNRQIDSRPRPDGFALKGVAPNWLTSGAPQYGGGGGPGSWPTAPVFGTGSTAAQSAGPEFWEFTLPAALSLPDRAQRGNGVDVVILDTAPSRLEMDNALSSYPGHPLLGTLLAAGRLDLIPGGGTHLLDEVNIDLIDHDYVMIDHGLFVAGIIHSIAPLARLHLVEVLNPFGVGSLETIARGFKAAEQINTERAAGQEPTEQPIGPLVLNCSLTLNIPPPEILERAAQEDIALEGVTPEQLRRWSESFRDICRVVSNQNITIVAAAGNDRHPEDVATPQARYPAAFPEVLGVGALNPGSPPTAASYSNLSDVPSQAGIATLGGKANGGSTDPSQGIIGIYTRQLPDGTGNTSGWARWAGTSFATPIISGVLAALIAEGKANPKQDISNAYTGADDILPIGEYFPVQQG